MLLLFVLAVGLYLLGRYLHAKGMVWAGAFGSLGAFFVALVALAGPAFARLLRGPSQASMTRVDQAADDLAKALGRQMADEERLRRINDPRPLPVSWDVTPTAVTAMLGVLDELADDNTGDDDLRTLSGEFGDILVTFYRVPSRRLVILGSAGAGKSVLVTKLARELLAVRKSGMPVPVIVSAATWNPAKGLAGWITDQLVRTHPGLAIGIKAATGRMVSLAEELANGGVLPILDGLDELPQDLRAEAIRAINAWGSDIPVVVASRPDEYLAAVTAAGRPVSQAMVIEILPLQVSQVESYLGHATAATRAERWRRVFDAMEDDPHGPLATVLTTPLMVWLARTIYEAPDSDPNELAQGKLLTDRKEIEHHLLDAFVPAVYSNRNYQAWHRWTPKQAQHWLSFLAAFLTNTNDQDLASWRLSNIALSWRPIGFALRWTLLFATAWRLALWVIHSHREWRYGTHPPLANLSGLLRSGLLGRHIFPTVNHTLSDSPPSIKDLTRLIIHSISSWPWHSLPALELWVALIALVCGVFSVWTEQATLVYRSDGRGDIVRIRYAHDVKEPRMIRIWPSRIVRAVVNAAGQGSAAMVCIIIGIVIIFALASFQPSSPPHSYPNPSWHDLVMFCQTHSVWLLLLIGALWGMTTVPNSFLAPIDISRAISPTKVLQIDRQATISIQLAKKAARAILTWLCFGPQIAIAYSLYSVVNILCGIFLGGMGSAWGRYADARTSLACGRRMSLRAMTFLSDAHNRGIFRQAGAIYQFRHISLQQRLSTKYTDLPIRWVYALVQGNDKIRGRPYSTWWPRRMSFTFQSVWAQRFQETAALLSTQVEIGPPTGEVRDKDLYSYLFQSFDGNDDDWIIFARNGHQPVLISGSLWRALRKEANERFYANSLGCPVMSDAVPIQNRVIHADAKVVALAGGLWGSGRLVRNDENANWDWEPDVNSNPAMRPDKPRGKLPI
jgi:hypothetical protein